MDPAASTSTVPDRASSPRRSGQVLGQGSYGQVVERNGYAVKRFDKISYVIQEFMALSYIADCPHILHCAKVDFARQELHLDLWEGSLRAWLETHPPYPNSPTYAAANGLRQQTLYMFARDTILGLIELHDRGLAHGDLKPSNILVQTQPSVKAVLGDCGFVSIAKYTKVDRTASAYRDPLIVRDTAHDLFSLGVCLIEMLGGARSTRSFAPSDTSSAAVSYAEAQRLAQSVPHPQMRGLVMRLLSEDRSVRPTARMVLRELFGEEAHPYVLPSIVARSSLNVQVEKKRPVRVFIKRMKSDWKIRRTKRGYAVLCAYFARHKLDERAQLLYAGAMLVILSSLFGESGFRLRQAADTLGVEIEELYGPLTNLISEREWCVNILLLPSF